MDLPFPLTSLTLVNNREPELSWQTCAPAADHDLQELLLLTFPKTYERRLELVQPEWEEPELA